MLWPQPSQQTCWRAMDSSASMLSEHSRETAGRKSRLESAATLCDRVLILNRAGVCCAPETSRFALRGLSFWERHLPWALPRIQQVIAESKSRGSEAGRAGACSKDASSTFARGMRSSGIAVRAAARRHGSGHVGSPKRDTGPQWRARRSGTARAGAIANASGTGNKRRKMRFRSLRG